MKDIVVQETLEDIDKDGDGKVGKDWIYENCGFVFCTYLFR